MSFQRRSSRHPFVAQIVLSGRDSSGEPFSAPGETIEVSLHGARVRTSARLYTGLELQVNFPSRRRIKPARVVWEARNKPGEFGIELHVPEHFWGIHFGPSKNKPPRRPLSQAGEPHAGGALAAASLTVSARVAGEPVVTFGPAPPNGGECGPGPVAGAAATQPPAAQGAGIEARVTGISSLRMPFDQAALILPQDRRTAVLPLPMAVDVGTRLRVLFTNGRAIFVRVTRLSGRGGDKGWNVWVERF